MKKLFILPGLLLSLALYGQFNTESVYFSGMTNFSTGIEIVSDDFGSDGYIPLDLRLEGGYFIKNRLAVGGNLTLEDIQIPLWGIPDNHYSVHFGPNVRYYLASEYVDKNENAYDLYLFGYAFYGFEPSHNLYGIQFGPGANYFFNEHIALDARFSYTYKHTFNRAMGGSHNNHRFLFELGITVFFPSIRFFDTE